MVWLRGNGGGWDRWWAVDSRGGRLAGGVVVVVLGRCPLGWISSP